MQLLLGLVVVLVQDSGLLGYGVLPKNELFASFEVAFRGT